MNQVLILFACLTLAAGGAVVYVGSGDDCSTLLYVETLTVAAGAEAPIDLTAVENAVTSCSVTDKNGRKIEITFGDIADSATSFKLAMDFSLTSTGYWVSSNMSASYTNSSESMSLSGAFKAVAPISTRFSSACSLKTDTTLTDAEAKSTAKVTMNMFQIQVYNVKEEKFNTEIQCVNWISEGAWMGIVAGVLTIVILIFSIMMLLSTATPDRFESAKSKCLIIPHEH